MNNEGFLQEMLLICWKRGRSVSKLPRTVFCIWIAQNWLKTLAGWQYLDLTEVSLKPGKEME